MANRIVGNVIIVDSAMGNALLLTSANQAINLGGMYVNAFAFLANDTTGAITLTQVNTALDLVFVSSFIPGGQTRPALGLFTLPFANPLRVSDLKAPIVTAGTGFIYLA